MKAVQTCWTAVDQEISGQLASEQIVARVQLKAGRYLEACCILDGVSNLEERLGDDLGEQRTDPPLIRTSSTAGTSRDVSGKSQAPPTPTSKETGRMNIPAAASAPTSKEAQTQPKRE